MPQQSITGYLRDTIKTILRESGEEMSLPELKAAVRSRSASDFEFHSSHLAGACRQVLEDPDFISPGRGRYLYAGGNSENSSQGAMRNIQRRLAVLYRDCAKKAADILNEADFANCSDEELQKVLEIRTTIAQLKEFTGRFQNGEE